jgi:RNA chaperone Hfq
MRQNDVLARLKDQRRQVSLHLVNGAQVKGRIAAFDLYGIFVRDALGATVYVYKQSIRSVIELDR